MEEWLNRGLEQESGEFVSYFPKFAAVNKKFGKNNYFIVKIL